MKIGIIGGGPTGLYMAILLARTDHSVIVFEKRPEYTRRQIVTNAIPNDLGGGRMMTPEERAKYFPQACALTTAVFTDMTSKPHCYHDTDEAFLRAIPIQDLERGLAQFATDLGVLITHQQANPKILASVVDVVIGADGGRSVTREAMGIGMTTRKVSDAVVFTWQRDPTDHVPLVKGSPRDAAADNQFIDGGQNELFRMFPAKGDSFQYGAIQIWDPEAAQKIADIHGIDMTYDMVKPYIGSLVRDFARLYAVEEKYLDRMEFNYFPISIGQADRFSGGIGEDRGTPGFIIGDAAIGVHFFSGSGMPSGFGLARLLVDSMNNTNSLDEAARLYEHGAKQYIDSTLFGMEQLHTLRNVVELGTCDKENVDAFMARARRSSPGGVSVYEDKFESNVNYCMFMNGLTAEEAVKHHAFQWYRGRLRNGTIDPGDKPHDAIGKPELVVPGAVFRPYHTLKDSTHKPKKATRKKATRRRSTRKKKATRKKRSSRKKRSTTRKKRSTTRKKRSSRCRRGRVRGGSRRGRCRKRCANGSRFNGSTCRRYRRP